MWNKGKPSKSRKSYNYLKRLKGFRDEVREMREYLATLEEKCNNILQREEQRIEEENGVN